MNKSSPKLISSFPKNNSVNISKNTHIVLNFNEPVYASDNGEVIIKNFKNNEVIETMNTNSMLIVGSGSNKITIHLSNSLKENSHYYVLISSNSFRNINNDYFIGIFNNKNINFKTAKKLLPNLIDNYISDDFKYIYLTFNKEMFSRRGEKLNTEHFRLSIVKGITQLSSLIPKSIKTNDNLTFEIEIEFSDLPTGDEVIKIYPFSNNSIFDSNLNPWTSFKLLSLDDVKYRKYINNINKNNNETKSKKLNQNYVNKYILYSNKRNNSYFDQNIIPKVFYNSTINRDKKSSIENIINNPLLSKQVIYFNQLNLHQAFNYKKQGKTYGTTKIPWKLETLNELYMTYNEQVDYYMYVTKIPYNKSNFSYLLMEIKNVMSQLAYSKNLYYTNKVISYKPDSSVRTPQQLINLIKKFS